MEKIISQVLEEHGIQADAYQFQLGSLYPEREYCVQYDETDLHFVQRLCEEEGIHYHFQHSAEGHILTFGDDQTPFPRLAPLAYQQDTGLVADDPVIKHFGARLETRTSQVTRRACNWKPRPTAIPSPSWKTTTTPAATPTANVASTWPSARWNVIATISNWPEILLKGDRFLFYPASRSTLATNRRC